MLEVALMLSAAALAGCGAALWFSRREAGRLREEKEAATVRAGELESQAAAAGVRAENLSAQLEAERARAAAAESRRDDARDEAGAAREKVAALEAELRKLPDGFKTMAQQILEEKSAAFGAGARKEVEQIVQPLTADLKSFRARAEAIHTDRSKESAALREKIDALQRDAGKVAEDANNLTRALKGDQKALGDWGEITLERILEDSGLRRGAEYEAQPTMTGADGRSQRPDFKILLPEGRHLIADSKASLTAYHAYVAASTEAEREQALKEHVGAVRNHARGLAEKHYQRGGGVNSPDFVFMFMPIEAAWLAALRADARLFDDSYGRKVILVARTTLLPTLKTVAQLWKLERQTENAREIAKLAGRMRDKFADLLGEMNNMKRALDSAGDAHEKIVRKLDGPRDSLIRQAERLEEMGANAKKPLPRLTAGAEEE